MSRTNVKPAAIKTAFKQMSRATAHDICEDYREVITRLKRLADNLAALLWSRVEIRLAPSKRNFACLKKPSMSFPAACCPNAIDECLNSKEC